MKQKLFQTIALLLILFITSGCAPGLNSVLFTTRSNVGLDVNATPPTTEVGIAREEFVIAPTYEKGQTHPVMASFSSGQNFASKFAFGVGSTFSTGEAAYIMAKLYNSKAETIDYKMETGCKAPFKPKLTKVLKNRLNYVEAGNVKPFIFTTNTMFGIKVGWGAPAPAAFVPNSLKIGFNRQEIAFTPAGIEKCAEDWYAANVPSLLATLDAQTNIEGSANSDGSNAKLTYLQYFATGVAASELSKKRGVRKAMFLRLDPDNAEAFLF